MFSEIISVPYDAIGEDGDCKWAFLLTALQNASLHHADAIDDGFAHMMRAQEAWILSWWRIEMTRFPRYGEAITVTTWVQQCAGVTALRGYCITAGGATLGVGEALWLHYSHRRARLTKPTAEVRASYGEEHDAPFAAPYTELPLLPDLQPQPPVTVMRRDLDTNHHVNNVRYLEYALEYLPCGKTPTAVRVHYHRAAHYGDCLIPRTATCGGRYDCALTDADGAIYVTVTMQEGGDEVGL